MSIQRYGLVKELVKQYKAKTLMEIGVYKGIRSLDMIQGAIEAGAKPEEVKYYGFDLFKEGMTKELFENEMAKMPLSEKEITDKLSPTGACIYLFQGNTKTTLPVFVKVAHRNEIFPDFIFIDGGHSVETVTSDWENVRKIMHHGTIVLFDDYFLNASHSHLGCRCVVDKLLFENDGYQIELLGNDDYQGLKIKMAKVTFSQFIGF